MLDLNKNNTVRDVLVESAVEKDVGSTHCKQQGGIVQVERHVRHRTIGSVEDSTLIGDVAAKTSHSEFDSGMPIELPESVSQPLPVDWPLQMAWLAYLPTVGPLHT